MRGNPLWQILTVPAIDVHHEAVESMNISLPEPLKQFVDGQIAAGRYSSASEYIRELIREVRSVRPKSDSRHCCSRGCRAKRVN